MKKLVIMAGLGLFLVMTCKKAENRPVPKESNADLDSVTIHDTIGIADAISFIYSSKILYFPFVHNKQLLDHIYFKYKNVGNFSKPDLKINEQRELLEHYDQIKELSKNKNVHGLWFFKNDMQLKYILNQFMYIRYTDITREGMGQNSRLYVDKVFDLNRNKELELSDIINLSKEDLFVLLKKNLHKILSSSAADDHNRSQTYSHTKEVSYKIPRADNFYFDRKGLYFHYNPYEIISTSPVDVVIPVYWEQLRENLQPEFKKRMNITGSTSNDDEF